MNKIQELEESLREWKATYQELADTDEDHNMRHAAGVCDGLSAALKIITRPPNQENADVCSCTTPKDIWCHGEFDCCGICDKRIVEQR